MTAKTRYINVGESLDAQLIAVIRASQTGPVLWLVKDDSEVYEKLLEPHTLKNPVSFSFKALPAFTSSKVPFYIVDQGLVNQWFELPSGANVQRVVARRRYPEVLQKISSVTPLPTEIIVYLVSNPTRIISDLPEVKAPPLSLPYSGLTSEQLLVLNQTPKDDLSLLFISLVASWEREIFSDVQSLADLKLRIGQSYSKWLDISDLLSLQNLSQLIYLKQKKCSGGGLDCKDWTRTESLNFEKVAEVWRFYLSLKDYVNQTASTAIQSTEVKGFSWEALFRKAYEGHTVSLEGDIRLAGTPLHPAVATSFGKKVIPLVIKQFKTEKQVEIYIDSDLS